MNRRTVADRSPAPTLPPGALRIVQVTDSHLYADANGSLAGINTLHSFHAVLDLIRSSTPAADLILATGDLVHDASLAGYQRVKHALAEFDIPSYCLPGNHDLPQVMAECLNQGTISSPKWITRGDWLIVMLDSTVRGREGGHLSEAELGQLQQGLEQHPDHHALICLHHHPVPIGSAWMDRMALDNPDRFFSLLQRFPKVQGILWGHIHQAYDARYRGMRLMGSPSTCIQFEPLVDQFGIDDSPPGLRWLELLPDGSIRSGIQRLEQIPLGLDLSSVGY